MALKTILSLGDCNTLGINENHQNAYPEKFAQAINHPCLNCGYTMSTTREGKHFFNAFNHPNVSIITIQYGLVDSWSTFKYSPYVLYYPETFGRKIGRKIVKKYKKICKSLGLNSLFGTKKVVPLEEYIANIEAIIQASTATMIILIDTIPNKETYRNESIQHYNQALSQLAMRYKHCYKLDIYETFSKKMELLYSDDTHMNDLGHQLVTQKLVELYENSFSSL
ncbi:MAG: GDSL-type esterase/lipase family protein [Sulfurospirillaceae bacterium]|nr:GDSL-type esterase/lipase family protein [Sulfurospirillaceae bacterium]